MAFIRLVNGMREVSPFVSLFLLYSLFFRSLFFCIIVSNEDFYFVFYFLKPLSRQFLIGEWHARSTFLFPLFAPFFCLPFLLFLILF